MTGGSATVLDMPTAAVEVRFAGAAVSDGHEMDVEAYAGSLLSLGRAYTRAAQVMHPSTPAPRVRIRANEPGSFVVELVIADVAGLFSQAVTLLSGPEVTAAANVTALAAVVPGAMGLIRRIGGKAYTKQEEVAGGITFIVEGDVHITVDRSIAELIDDQPFRRAAWGSLQIIEDAGGDASMEIAAGDVDEIFHPGDREFLAPPSDEGSLTVTTVPMTLTLVKVVLEGNGAWTFKHGDGPSWTIAIHDNAFKERMERGEMPIVPGTQLACDVEVTEAEQPDGQVKVTRRIVSVRGYRRPGTQLKLFATD